MKSGDRDMLHWVKRPHQPDSPETLVASRGEELKYERRPTEWAGWLWCTNAEGRSAWVPEAWVEQEGDRCRLRRDYDSTELSISEGDVLEVELTESGWAWGHDSSGRRGWVPLDAIEPDDRAAC